MSRHVICAVTLSLIALATAALAGVDDDARAATAATRPADDTKVLLDERISNWQYRLSYLRASSRSRTTVGKLRFDGKPITAEAEGTLLWTPWGPMTYRPGKGFIQGWHRIYGPPTGEGKPLASPDPNTSALIRRHWQALRDAGESFSMTVIYRDGNGGGWLCVASGHPTREFPPKWKAWEVTASKEDLQEIVDRVMAEGLLARAVLPATLLKAAPPPPDRELIRVRMLPVPLEVQFGDGKEIEYRLPLDATVETAEQLRRVLNEVADAKARKQIADMLSALEEFVKRRAADEKNVALTEPQARALAARLASDAFARRTFFHANGKPVAKIHVAPESFNAVSRDGGRWVLKMSASRGPEAFVNFRLDGTDPQVTVSYAWR